MSSLYIFWSWREVREEKKKEAPRHGSQGECNPSATEAVWLDMQVICLLCNLLERTGRSLRLVLLERLGFWFPPSHLLGVESWVSSRPPLRHLLELSPGFGAARSGLTTVQAPTGTHIVRACPHACTKTVLHKLSTSPDICGHELPYPCLLTQSSPPIFKETLLS